VRQVNCYIPIKVCITGRLSDAQLDELGESLVRALVARIADAQQRISSRQHSQPTRGATEIIKEGYKAAWHDVVTEKYNVPSYQGQGAPTGVSIRERSVRQRESEAIQKQEQSALRRIHELLSTGITDWFVTEAEAREVLRVLQGLKPEVLLYTVMVMRLTGDWNKFRRKLPESDQEALTRLEITIDPNVGYIMPWDEIKLEVYSSSRSKEDLGSTEFTVYEDGVHLPYLQQPIPIVGLLPEAAAKAIADAYVDALILLEPFVRLGVSKRGFHYAGRNQGPFANPIFFTSASRISPTSPESQRRRKQAEFADYIAGVSATDAFTASAIQNYLNWIETRYSAPDFLTRSPVDLWEWALKRASQPAPASPLRPFLELMHSMSAQLNIVPPAERTKIQESLSRYMAWLDLHRNDPNIARYNPVDIWVRAYLKVTREEIEAEVRQAAQKRAEPPPIDWPSVDRKFGEVLQLLARVWHMPEPEVVEAKTMGVGYLIWGSEAERRARDNIARAFLHDVIQRMTEPGFTSSSAKADFADWLQQHPQQYQEFLLAQAYPDVEKYQIPIDIPAWQTAVEVGIGFIPIVGQVVGAYEVIGGEDLFGHPLSTTDRAILGAAILLPAAGKIFRVGRAAVTASTIARDYRLSAREADALFRATARIGPGSSGARLLATAKEDILAGKPVRDPEKLKQLDTLMREMGLTERSTATALGSQGAAGARAEAEAAEEASRLGGTEKPAAGRGPSGPSGGGPGAGGGRIPGGKGASLLQRQAGAALRTEAASLERQIAALRSEAEELERSATALQETRPDRAGRMQQRAAQRRRVAEALRGDVEDFRRQAGEFESGSRSATADLPGPEDLDLLFAEARSETGVLQIPLARAERDPRLLPRLLRPLLQSRTGNRVVFRAEGGAGRQLVQLGEGGSVTLTRGTTIYLNFGSYERAVEFLKKGRGRIVAFEVDEAWVQSARSAAIPEHGTGVLRGRQPRLVDIRFAEDQMEIPSNLIDELQQFIVPGSGRMVEVTP
jgi:hypothetical protein